MCARGGRALGEVPECCTTSAVVSVAAADANVDVIGFEAQSDERRSAVAVDEVACWIATFGPFAVAGKIVSAALLAAVVGENTTAVAEGLDAVSERWTSWQSGWYRSTRTSNDGRPDLQLHGLYTHLHWTVVADLHENHNCVHDHRHLRSRSSSRDATSIPSAAQRPAHRSEHRPREILDFPGAS